MKSSQIVRCSLGPVPCAAPFKPVNARSVNPSKHASAYFKQHAAGAAPNSMLPVSAASPTPVGLMRSHRRSVRVAVLGPDDAGADGIVFGKPQAPKEIYEGIARDARAELLGELAKGVAHARGETGSARMDAVVAALAVASEDDAVKTRTHIALPTASFSARLDAALAYCVTGLSALPATATQDEQLEAVRTGLFNVWGLKLAKSMEDGAFSPYRVYMHQVLAQKCGTQAAVAVVLDAVLARLHAAGHLTFPAQVGLPADPSQTPVARVLRAGATASKGDALGESITGVWDDAARVRWVGPVGLVAECLDQLKRFFWSWDWPLSSASGFDACARGLLGAGGRAGRVNAAVGVMQARGRPYGNVELALLATERAAAITAHAPHTWAHQVQLRDYGVQLLHTGRYTQGRAALNAHTAWLRASPASAAPPAPAPVVVSPGAGSVAPAAPAAASFVGAGFSSTSASLVEELLLWEARRALEGAFAAGAASGGGVAAESIIDPERDA